MDTATKVTKRSDEVLTVIRNGLDTYNVVTNEMTFYDLSFDDVLDTWGLEGLKKMDLDDGPFSMI